MEYKKQHGKYIVRLDKGEEVVSSLKLIAKKENIQSGFISAIGAADLIEVGLYQVEKKEYVSKRFIGDFEIVSCLGNLSMKDGEVYLHLHMCFSDQDCHGYGGHLNECRISGTFECVIGLSDDTIKRKVDPVTGLNIFDLGDK